MHNIQVFNNEKPWKMASVSDAVISSKIYSSAEKHLYAHVQYV